MVSLFDGDETGELGFDVSAKMGSGDLRGFMEI